MLFIEKSKPPRSLLKFVALQKSVNLHPSYKDLRSPYIDDLDTILYQQQRGVCCYCMQVLPQSSSLRTREHFLPESKFKLDEVNYYNLYLACTEKDGTNTGHCDKTKGDILISKYIGHPNCEDFFKYNRKGEILPQKLSFEEWGKFSQSTKNDLFETSPETAEILATISILRLNQKELVNKRKDFISDILKTIMFFTSREQCESEIQKYKSSSVKNPQRFAGVALYFLREHLKKIV